jgi:hypothetical protein
MKLCKILFISLMLLTACSQKKAEQVKTETPSVTPPKYLYVAAGACYSGSNTTFTSTTSSNLVYRLKLATGQKDTAFADYYSAPANAGDSPINVIEQDADNLMVLIENTTSGRRIEKFPKTPNPNRSIFTSNTTMLSAALKFLLKTSDGGFLVSKGAGTEKMTSQGVRLGAPYIGTNLGATCGATITNISSLATNPSNKIFFTHAAAGQNRFGVLSPNGYTVAADCLAAQAAPDVNAFPTAITYIASTNQVLVAYAGNALTTKYNSIYVYDFNDTTNVISNPVMIYDSATYTTAGYLLYGISSMTFDADNSTLYVSTAISNATTVVNYAIEKLTYDSTAKTLTRATTTPFYNYGNDTKCISGLVVAQ